MVFILHVSKYLCVFLYKNYDNSPGVISFCSLTPQSYLTLSNHLRTEFIWEEHMEYFFAISDFPQKGSL